MSRGHVSSCIKTLMNVQEASICIFSASENILLMVVDHLKHAGQQYTEERKWGKKKNNTCIENIYNNYEWINDKIEESILCDCFPHPT